MPILLTPDQLKKLERKKRLKKFRKPKDSIAAQRILHTRLKSAWQRILFPATDRIKALVKSGASPSQIASEIEQTLFQVENEYNIEADEILFRWKLSLDDTTKAAVNASIKNSLGVDVSVLYDEEKISNALAMVGQEAKQLIKTIPTEYLGGVTRAINDNFKGVTLPEGRSLIEQIHHLSGVSKTRARIIARDQTTKMQATLTQIRQEDIGIEEYIWRNAGDQRVVGNPSGRYPKGNKAHMNHWVRNGKKYRWDSPPPDGHPGNAPLCRCWPQAVINIDKITERARML